LTIFGANVTEKVGSQRYFIFSPHLTSASALPSEMQKHKNSILSLKLECCNPCLPPIAISPAGTSSD